MKVLFIGSTKRGYLALKALAETDASITGIISLLQDEHENERYEEKIKDFANYTNVPLCETKWMKDQDYAKLILTQFKPDIAFVVGCRILIHKDIYTIPRYGTLAVHDSLLPEYRGFAPLNWSLINGEDHSGVTLFYLNERMDGGDIVAQKRIPIEPDDTAPVVYERVCKATVDVVIEGFAKLWEGKPSRIKQDYSLGSFTCSRVPADGFIDWSNSTTTIYNQVRALAYPYPGAFTYFNVNKLTVWRAHPVTPAPRYVGSAPGRVINVSRTEGSIEVLTGDGVLKIFEVQLEGEQSTMASNVVQSVRATLGLQVSEVLERLLKLEGQVADLLNAQRHD